MSISYGDKKVGVLIMKSGSGGISEIPPATKQSLGGVVVGSGLDIDAHGILSLDPELDETPTVGSNNLVNSDSVAIALKDKSDASHTHQDYLLKSSIMSSVHPTSANPVSSKAIASALSNKAAINHTHYGMVTSTAVANIIISPTEPSDEDGVDGDLWFVYKE